jgi:protein-L-isoaspartate(D-aspartate) O-methyltransferase
MIEEQLVRRGIADARVLEAFRAVPREAFVPERLGEVAYQDSPLPIGGGQTISQPFVVALTLEALALTGTERVLEIGTGSGYAAALLGRLAAEVHTVERLAALADEARQRLAERGCKNVHVTLGDGSLGLPEHAPYDAIAVAAAGPSVPAALRDQLAVGGRLVMPVVRNGGQALVRITRQGPATWKEERLLDVTFVPLIGAQAWPEAKRPPATVPRDDDTVRLVQKHAEPVEDLRALADRIGGARVVLLGGAIDGSLELQRLRVRLTQELLARGGFQFVAIEGDWSDAARIDEHVRDLAPRPDLPFHAFTRFPGIRWRNKVVAAFVDDLHARGDVGFHGLDVFGTTGAVSLALERVGEHDSEAAREARSRCTTISPWRRGVADILTEQAAFEPDLLASLHASLSARTAAVRVAGPRAAEAARRAAEDGDTYYRYLLHGALDAWSIRSDAMANMLRALLDDYGPQSRAIVWAHDAHVADATGTETGVRGHRTLGQLARLAFDGGAYLVGLDAGVGEILASPSWGAKPAVMELGPAPPSSHERLFHDAGLSAFALPLRSGASDLREALRVPRLSRAIGAVYRPDAELVTHYLAVAPSRAFDELVFVDRTTPVEAIGVAATCEPENDHPLGFG